MTRPRFRADNDLDQRIIAARRLDPAVDFQTAAALYLQQLPDPEVLALAARGADTRLARPADAAQTLQGVRRLADLARPHHRLAETARGVRRRAAAPAVGGE